MLRRAEVQEIKIQDVNPANNTCRLLCTMRSWQRRRAEPQSEETDPGGGGG